MRRAILPAMPGSGRRRFCVLLLASAAGLGGCLSPTLPLPPPGEPDIEQVGEGRYQLSGRVRAPGTVLTLNLRTGLIVGTSTRGPYSFVIEARPADRIQFWYETGGRASDSLVFDIPGAPDSGVASDAGTREQAPSDANPAADATAE